MLEQLWGIYLTGERSSTAFLSWPPLYPIHWGYYLIFRAILENFSHHKTQKGHIVEVGGKVRSCCLINSRSGLCEDSSSTCMKLIIDQITSTTASFPSITPLLLNPEGPTDLRQGWNQFYKSGRCGLHNNARSSPLGNRIKIYKPM